MRKRSHRVVVYFNDEELADLSEKVQSSNLSREELIRRAIRGVTIKEGPPADLPLLIRELRRIGCGLNQLVALAHSKGFLDTPQLRKALESNRAVEKLIVDTYTRGGG